VKIKNFIKRQSHHPVQTGSEHLLHEEQKPISRKGLREERCRPVFEVLDPFGMAADQDHWQLGLGGQRFSVTAVEHAIGDDQIDAPRRNMAKARRRWRAMPGSRPVVTPWPEWSGHRYHPRLADEPYGTDTA
jgi:hypothetical protein